MKYTAPGESRDKYSTYSHSTVIIQTGSSALISKANTAQDEAEYYVFISIFVARLSPRAVLYFVLGLHSLRHGFHHSGAVMFLQNSSYMINLQ